MWGSLTIFAVAVSIASLWALERTLAWQQPIYIPIAVAADITTRTIGACRHRGRQRVPPLTLGLTLVRAFGRFVTDDWKSSRSLCLALTGFSLSSADSASQSSKS